MKNLLTAALCAISLITVLTTTANAQCPDPNVGVEPQCQPAPAWVAKRAILKLSEHCFVEIDYCEQWVCRGIAGLSRSRISISTLRFFDDVGGTGTGVGCYLDAILPEGTFSDERQMNEMLGTILQKMVEQGVVLSDGPPKPCSENPTDMLFEIVTSPCYNVGYWFGTVDNHLVGGGSGQGEGALYYHFCSGTYSCRRNWRFCTQPDGSIKKDLVSVNPLPNPLPWEDPLCPESQPPAFPANGIVAGTGIVAGQSYNLSMTGFIPWTEESQCWSNCLWTPITP